MVLRNLAISSLAVLALGSGSLRAQTAPKVTVKVTEVKTQEQKTPNYQVGNVKEHAWRPKNWLEIDVPLEAKKEKTPGETSSMVDSLEVKFFVGLNAVDAARKNFVLTGSMTVLNIPTKAGENPHILAYVSPSTLRRALGDNKAFTASADIKAIAVEISYNGQVIGGYPIGQGKWWDDLSKFAVIEGEILPKAKTPFAPLWGDYDLDVRLK